MKNNNENTRKARADLRCINMGIEYWSMLKELSKIQERSISSYLRCLVVKEYKKVTKKDEPAFAS